MQYVKGIGERVYSFEGITEAIFVTDMLGGMINQEDSSQVVIC